MRSGLLRKSLLPVVEVLEQQGIVPGIKVDKGAKAMANFPGEKPRITASKRNKNRRE